MRRKREVKLIPLEKSRRVIHLDKRGRERRHMSVPVVILMVLGALCLLYCLGIGMFMGYGTRFFLVWGLLGVILLVLGYAMGNHMWLEEIPGWLKTSAGVGAGLCLLIFVIVEGLILSQFHAAADPGADYCIILGAQMKAHGPSDVLKRRLDTAIDYLQENPDTKVIVSGGQGSNEPVSEAQGMHDYLTKEGIAADRILREDQSENTYGNLINSSALLNPNQDNVVVVTNNFHMYRAVGIARKLGYRNVSGQAADSYMGMIPNNLLREFMGVMKDMLVGNL